MLLGLTARIWLMIGIITLLLSATFRFNLSRLWFKVSPLSDAPEAANWGHSLFVPVIGLYYLYLNREQLLNSKIEPLILGGRKTPARVASLVIVLLGVLVGAYALFESLRGQPLNLASTIGLGIAALACLHLLITNPFNKWWLLTSLAALLGGAGIFWYGGHAPAMGAYFKVAGVVLGAMGALALILDWGLAIVLCGLAVFQYGIYPGRNDWTSDMGIPLVIFGVVLTMCGWQVMKIAWFPIAFLICAIPWPPLVYSRVASPLQELAATIAVGTLNICQITSEQAGTKIIIDRGIGLPPRTLNVAEACAGMRSLMTFISVGAAMAFLSHRPLWQKFFITLSAIPIAIFCNVMRVSGQGLLDRLWSEQVSEGFAHAFVGLVMLIPAFFLLLLVQWVLDKIVVEEVDETDTGKSAAVAAPAGARIITRRVNRAPRTSTGESA